MSYDPFDPRPAWLQTLPPPEAGPPPSNARVCPECQALPEEVQWENYVSDDASWGALAGRAGVIARCSRHGHQVAEQWDLIS